MLRTPNPILLQGSVVLGALLNYDVVHNCLSFLKWFIISNIIIKLL